MQKVSSRDLAKELAGLSQLEWKTSSGLPPSFTNKSALSPNCTSQFSHTEHMTVINRCGKINESPNDSRLELLTVGTLFSLDTIHRIPLDLLVRINHV